MTLTWPKTRRLTCRAQYTACYDRGSRHYTRNFVVFALERVEPLPVLATASSAVLMGGTGATPVELSCPATSGIYGMFVDTNAQGAMKEQGAGSGALPASGLCGRLGLAVTRKCGNAVERNRIKRVLREFFRLHQHDMPIMDIVVTPKRHLRAAKVHLALVERDLAPLLETLRRSGRLTAPERSSLVNVGLPGGASQPGASSNASAPAAGGLA